MENNNRKAAAISRKIQTEFPNSPEGRLMFAVIATALKDAAAERGVTADEARRYLKGKIHHAEVCGVSSEYIHRVIKAVGFSLEVNKNG